MNREEQGCDAFVTAEVGLERLAGWLESQEGLRLMLASMPPGSTLADALVRHRTLRQLGRRPSACMAPELEPTQ